LQTDEIIKIINPGLPIHWPTEIKLASFNLLFAAIVVSQSKGCQASCGGVEVGIAVQNYHDDATFFTSCKNCSANATTHMAVAPVVGDPI
jgi:hypothetical protein